MAVITKILINIFIFICFKINTSYEFSKSSSIYLHILDDLLKHCDERSDFRDESIARILRKTRIYSQFRRWKREKTFVLREGLTGKFLPSLVRPEVGIRVVDSISYQVGPSVSFAHELACSFSDEEVVRDLLRRSRSGSCREFREPEPGPPSQGVTRSPGTLPFSRSWVFITAPLLILSAFTADMEPVRSSFLTVPYPMTTTSSRN